MNCDVHVAVRVVGILNSISNGLQGRTFALEERGGCCLVQVVCLTLILGCEVPVRGFQEGTPYSNILGALSVIFSFQINQDSIFWV